MAGFGEEIKIGAAGGDGVADQFLAGLVAFGGIDDIEAGVEGGVEKAIDRRLRGVLKTDLGAAVAEDGDVHAGLTQCAFFHTQLS